MNISVRILDATVVNVPAIIVTTAKNATPGQNDNNRPSLLWTPIELRLPPKDSLTTKPINTPIIAEMATVVDVGGIIIEEPTIRY